MDNVWVSSGSTTVEAMVNPIAAACAGDGLDSAFVPDTVYFLDNPGLGDALSDTKVLTRTLLEQYGVESPTIKTGHVDHETDFQGIATHFQDAERAGRNVLRPRSDSIFSVSEPVIESIS